MTELRAAVTLGLTGRYAVQARQARSGLELWAGDDHVELHVHDDAGSPTVAAAASSASGATASCSRRLGESRSPPGSRIASRGSASASGSRPIGSSRPLCRASSQVVCGAGR